MSRKPLHTDTLLDPQHALRVYLDSLLREVDTTEIDEGSEPDFATAATVEPAVSQLIPAPSIQHSHAQGSEDDRSESQQHPAEQPSQEARQIPAWAGTSFQSLSFRVSGLTLAAPLEKLNGIVELTDGLTELPGYAPWVLGLLSNRGRQVQVIDIGQIVMPERKPLNSEEENNHTKYVILINDGNFGLLADSLSQVLTLAPTDIRWRGVNGKRPWLAGTVIKQMCAILDIDQLCDQLQAGMRVEHD